MTLIQGVLIAATLLCTLVAGLVLTFGIVVMPGIRALGDREYLRAFQVIDGVIQRRQPMFALVWIGSVIALVAYAVLAYPPPTTLDHALLIGSVVLYLFGVQLPTFAINIPLNNKVQALDLDAIDDEAARAMRQEFEGRWNASNIARTVVAILVSIALLVQLLQL